MSLALDPLTDYQRSVGADIASHRAEDGGGPVLTNYLQSVISFIKQHKQDSKRNAKYKEDGDESLFNQLNNLSQMAGIGAIIPSIPFFGGTSLGFGSPSDISGQAKRTAENLFRTAVFGALFRPETVAFVQDRYNQALEERGYLKFKFLNANESNFVIPFFENPQIQETRQAKYAVNEVMNRNEPYRLFTGAQPRQVRLSFRMTLPHIMTFSMVNQVREAEKMMVYDSFWANNRNIQEANAWSTIASSPIVGHLGSAPPETFFQVSKAFHEEADFRYDVEFDSKWDDAVSAIGEFSEGQVPQPNQPYNNSQKILKGEVDGKVHSFLMYVQHMIDTIRSSVVAAANVGNGSTPGPPLAYLKFGTLFNEDQFTVESYDLKFDGKSGYDNVTLLPRVIDITLNLKSFGSNLPGSRGFAGGWDTNFVRLNK